MTRGDVADFLAALILVYTICIVGWVVLSLVFSLGVRMPYNRVLNAVMDFLRDVSNPFLGLFRKLPLQVGPLDLSPMVAIIVLQAGGGIIVSLIRGSCSPASPPCGPRRWPWRSSPPTRSPSRSTG